jgi:FKBP-type peptidyl-prolyl cis-trans isomerase FkpA
MTLCVAVLASGALAGCDDTPTSPTGPFQTTDLRVGTGATAVPGRVVAVHYIGWLYDASISDQKGAVFDTSRDGAPFAFTLGAGEVIEGWDRGVQGMSVGGLRRLVIPPSLGYGDTRAGPIPPYSTLIFEIELIAVN